MSEDKNFTMQEYSLLANDIPRNTNVYSSSTLHQLPMLHQNLYAYNSNGIPSLINQEEFLSSFEDFQSSPPLIADKSSDNDIYTREIPNIDYQEIHEYFSSSIQQNIELELDEFIVPNHHRGLFQNTEMNSSARVDLTRQCAEENENFEGNLYFNLNPGLSNIADCNNGLSLPITGRPIDLEELIRKAPKRRSLKTNDRDIKESLSDSEKILIQERIKAARLKFKNNITPEKLNEIREKNRLAQKRRREKFSIEIREHFRMKNKLAQKRRRELCNKNQ